MAVRAVGRAEQGHVHLGWMRFEKVRPGSIGVVRKKRGIGQPARSDGQSRWREHSDEQDRDERTSEQEQPSLEDGTRAVEQPSQD
jgi:hypothetical protein